jgi:hypothetical protein
MTEPGDRERQEPGREAGGDSRSESGSESDDQQLSKRAAAMQAAEKYTGASFSLVAAVGLFTWLGHLADEKLGFKVPWLTLAGAALGMTGGFISFFKTVLGKSQKKP